MSESKFSYRLGLDLGTNSIGWATFQLAEDGHPVALDRLGSRIFPNGTDPKTRASLAVKRRGARGIRRGLQRTTRRREKLMNALLRTDFFPKEQKRQNVLFNTNVYKIRYLALNQKVTPHELGRIFYSLNKHRGFQSNRKMATTSEDAPLITFMNNAETLLKDEGYETLGSYLYLARQQNGLAPVFSASKPTEIKEKTTPEELAAIKAAEERKIFNLFPSRKLLEQEFELLWQRQKDLHSSDESEILFTDENHDLFKEIMFFQRPLKPQVVGTCNFFSGRSNKQERGPLASPTIQQRQLLDRLNQLRYVPSSDPSSIKTPLTLEERDLFKDYIAGRVSKKRQEAKTRAKKFVSYEELRKILWGSEYDSFRFTHEDSEKKQGGELKGDATAYVMSDPNIMGSDWSELNLIDQENLIEILVADDSEEELKTEIEEFFERNNLFFEDDLIQKLLTVSLPTGYSQSESVLAAEILVDKMTDQVISFTEAVDLAYAEGQFPGKTSKSTLYDSLPYYGEVLSNYTAPILWGGTTNADEYKYGKIGNPVVHVALNQLRTVVNSIIKDYGYSPEEIVVETTRDLKNTVRKQADISKKQRENEKENKRLGSLLVEEYGVSGTRENREKLRLWEELSTATGGVDVYTGKHISQAMLFSSDSPIEVEHILPYSRSFDDSIYNKTLTFKETNAYKGDRAPYEAWGKNESVWEDMLLRASGLPADKKARFAPSAMEKYDERTDGFKDRQLNDSAYISKLARQYLDVLYNEDSGHNHVWAIPGQLTAMLRRKWGLNNILDTVSPEGQAVKNRNDHRHHAVDAAVIALTDRAALKKVSEYFKNNERDYTSAGSHDKNLFPSPVDGLHEEVKEKISNVIVSHKIDHGIDALHNETSLSIFSAEENPLPGTHLEKARLKDSDPETKLATFVVKRNARSQIINAYKPDGNYSMEIFKVPDSKKDKWSANVIRNFTAASTEYQEFMKSNNFSTKTFSGEDLVLRLRKTDVIQIEKSNPTLPAGKYRVKGISFIEAADRYVIMLGSMNETGKTFLSGPNQIIQIQPKIVNVSPSGKIN